MQTSNIDSDYTPKDFLQKLLGKSSKPQPNEKNLPELNPCKSNSQSTIEESNSARSSTSLSSSLRIQFQSIENIQDHPREHLDRPVIEQNTRVELKFKENQKKQSLRKQRHPYNPYKSQNPEALFGKISQNKSRPKHQNSKENSSSIDDERNLMLEKTKLFLKTALKGKVLEQQINEVLTGLQKGIQNPSEFDSLVCSFASKPNDDSLSQTPTLRQTSKKSLKQLSLSCLRTDKISYSKRSNSQKKLAIENKTKKQKKQQISETKKAILKSIKQMKQLVFLNEKSLRMTRNISMI